MSKSNLPVPAPFAACETMTSREIAELTGKAHKHVLTDIRKMLEELEIDETRFRHIYQDSQNRNQTEFLLPKRETLLLTSGYSIAQRAKIIDRWLELEEGQALSPAEQLLRSAQRLVEHERKINALEYQQSETQGQVNALVEGENYFTIVGYANIVGKRVDARAGSVLGKIAAGVCRKNGWSIGSATHPLYGRVNTYPRDAVEQAFTANET